MKEHQMYPYNPNSAEIVLTEKLKGVSYGWVDNQRAIVLEAMEDYAKQERNKAIDACQIIIHEYLLHNVEINESGVVGIVKKLESLKTPTAHEL